MSLIRRTLITAAAVAAFTASGGKMKVRAIGAAALGSDVQMQQALIGSILANVGESLWKETQAAVAVARK